MQARVLIARFFVRRIPAKYHDSLVLTMVTGAEIMLHSVLRLEDDFAIIRGRMAGSTDVVRCDCLMPHDQIAECGLLSRRCSETEVQTVFGSVMQKPPANAAGAAGGRGRRPYEAVLAQNPADIDEEKALLARGIGPCWTDRDAGDGKRSCGTKPGPGLLPSRFCWHGCAPDSPSRANKAKGRA